MTHQYLVTHYLMKVFFSLTVFGFFDDFGNFLILYFFFKYFFNFLVVLILYEKAIQFDKSNRQSAKVNMLLTIILFNLYSMSHSN